MSSQVTVCSANSEGFRAGSALAVTVHHDEWYLPITQNICGDGPSGGFCADG
jgi:hypothetical protein